MTRKKTDGWGTTLYQSMNYINPRTSTQIHTPTEAQGGWMAPFPELFDMLQYFETILRSVKSL